jgi:hypothetical protein
MSDRPFSIVKGRPDDDFDRKLTAKEIYARGERRLSARESSPVADEFTRLRNELNLAVASKEFIIAENYRLRRIIEAQDLLLERSKPRNEGCQCDKQSSSQ